MRINLNQSINTNSNEFNLIADDLQGNILKSHGRDHAAHVFIRFKSLRSAVTFIKKTLVPKITTARKQEKDSQDYKKKVSNGRRNFSVIALSQLGYGFLGIQAKNQPRDNSFQTDREKRLGILNDPKSQDWEEPLKTQYHCLFIIANTSKKSVQKSVRTIKKKLKSIASRVHIEWGEGIRNKQNAHIEHFGYVDGISQPHLLDDKIGEISRNNWDPLQNLDLALVKDPGGKTPNSYGSYLVFRKLKQDVSGWNKAVVDLAKKLNISPSFLGAQLVGRYKSGTPLIPVSPPQPGPSSTMNDFNYASDANGSKCPFHSHIRKTNPRGDGGFEDQDDEKRHLFVRRGITYGKQGTDNVGLLFMAYNSNIGNQFEFMQKNWANNISFPGGKNNAPHGLDPVIGQGSKSSGQNYVKSYGDKTTTKRIKPSFADFVSMQGSEYFFAPSISMLKNL